MIKKSYIGLTVEHDTCSESHGFLDRNHRHFPGLDTASKKLVVKWLRSSEQLQLLFINTFIDVDVEGEWNPSAVFPNVPMDQMETGSMSTVTSQTFVQSTNWVQLHSALIPQWDEEAEFPEEAIMAAQENLPDPRGFVVYRIVAVASDNH